MQTLYREYYQKRKRGFTGSEFRQTCESIAGADLSELFEYVYTTKEPDYAKYLAYGGLGIDKDYKIHSLENVDEQQVAIRKAWLNN
jgi:predicted metalloprotease with PDZ domain